MRRLHGWIGIVVNGGRRRMIEEDGGKGANVRLAERQTMRIDAMREAGLISTTTTAFVRWAVDQAIRRVAIESRETIALDRYLHETLGPVEETLDEVRNPRDSAQA